MPRPPASLDPAYALAWSFTRHRLLRTCERAVFWTYFGGRGLGLGTDDPDARRAFALRHLTSLLGLVGTAVHAAARDVIAAMLAGGPLPARAELLEGARFTLNEAWRTSQPDHVDRFWRYPGVYSALHEVVYRGALRPDEVARATERLRACLDAMLDAPVLVAIQASARDDVWLPETSLPVDFAPAPGQRAWGAVDFAYRHSDVEAVRATLAESASVGATVVGTAVTRARAADAVPGDPTWCVVDWKTGGRPDPSDEQLQLGTYALALAARGYRPTNGVFLGRVVDLLRREDRWYVLDADLLARTRATITADIARQRALMVDPATARPHPKAAWALARDRRHCTTCNFAALCQPEFQAELEGRRRAEVRTERGAAAAAGAAARDVRDAGQRP